MPTHSAIFPSATVLATLVDSKEDQRFVAGGREKAETTTLVSITARRRPACVDTCWRLAGATCRTGGGTALPPNLCYKPFKFKLPTSPDDDLVLPIFAPIIRSLAAADSGLLTNRTGLGAGPRWDPQMGPSAPSCDGRFFGRISAANSSEKLSGDRSRLINNNLSSHLATV
jgi:hypothetical protein